MPPRRRSSSERMSTIRTSPAQAASHAVPGASQLLNYLISQAYIPEFQVRWRWKPNSMAMWDNRSTQHYAVMDYPPCHRKMERAGIIGDKPF